MKECDKCGGEASIREKATVMSAAGLGERTRYLCEDCSKKIAIAEKVRSDGALELKSGDVLYWKDLVERAIRNAGHRDYIRRRYVAVTELFSYGTTTAREICHHFNLDPDEIVGVDESEDEEEDEYGD